MVRFLTLLLLPCALLLGIDPSSQIILTDPQEWVAPCSFPLEPIPARPSQVNVQYLLNDIQHNSIEKTTYHHYAMKALTQSGVSEVAQVSIDFVPSYEKVAVHAIQVFRNGVWSDRLQSARHSLLQREEELENDLYSGNFSLVYFLEDVCVGDIIEYSYTVEGEIPFFASHLTSVFHFQGHVVFERLYRRLLTHPEAVFGYKLFNTSEEPKIHVLSSTLCEWTWELLETPRFIIEEGCPPWHVSLAHVQISEYRSWKEVIDKFLSIYSLPGDLRSEPSPLMMEKINGWMQQTSDPEERAFLAVRFVQEEVRYLGFEEGIDGFRPTDPRKVFQRRFGDCKDKTFLLHALLDLMDIRSTPVLVHIDEGKVLPDLLPTPFGFNHIVLRIEIGGGEFWIDSTLYGQGGAALREVFCPIYHWGLPISQESTGLVDILGNYQEIPTLIETLIEVLSEAKAKMTIDRQFSGHKADYMRRYLEWRGTHTISEDFLNSLKKMYGTASIESPLAVHDDRQKNVIVTREVYLVPVQKWAGERFFRIFSLAIRNYLDSGLNPERSAPYALIYPLWVQEHIHLKNPLNGWESESDSYTYEHESLLYSHSFNIEGQEMDFRYEIKHLKDHVPVGALFDYWEMTNEIESDAVLRVNISSNQAAAG